MKKVFKFIGFTLFALVLIIGLAAWSIHLKGVPEYAFSPSPEIANLKIPRSDSASSNVA
jgi:hypothetical protein